MAPTQLDLEQLELLKRQRSSYKGQLTLFKKKYGGVDTLSIGSCESILHRIRTVYDKYSEIQSKIELLDLAAQSDREIFEDEYGNFESLLLNHTYDLKKPETPNNLSLRNNSVLDMATELAPAIEMRLPEIKLPSFSGKDTHWLRFRDLFQELIHKKNIDNAIKFHYLISHVSDGTAYSLIEGIPVTAENYELAWTTIYNKYNNEVAIQKGYLKQLYEIKPTVPHSSESLQEFIDHAVSYYNSLKALQVPVESWNLILVHHLSERLDNVCRTDVIKSSSDNTVLTFLKFITILQNRVRVLAALKPLTSSNTVRKGSSNSYRSNRNPNALISSIQTCCFCHGNHAIEKCPDFCDDKLTPNMRFQFIKGKRLCTNCLSSSHNVQNCVSTGCNKCQLKHHSILHFENSRQPQSSYTTNSKKPFKSLNITEHYTPNNTEGIQTNNQSKPSGSSLNEQVMLGTSAQDEHDRHSISSVDSVIKLQSSKKQIMLGTAVSSHCKQWESSLRKSSTR